MCDPNKTEPDRRQPYGTSDLMRDILKLLEGMPINDAKEILSTLDAQLDAQKEATKVSIDLVALS